MIFCAKSLPCNHELNVAVQFSKVLMDTYRIYTSCGNTANVRPTAFIDIRLPKDRFVVLLRSDLGSWCDALGTYFGRQQFLCPRSYDINVTPDKRKALIHQEQSLLEAFQKVHTPAFPLHALTWKYLSLRVGVTSAACTGTGADVGASGSHTATTKQTGKGRACKQPW